MSICESILEGPFYSFFYVVMIPIWILTYKALRKKINYNSIPQIILILAFYIFLLTIDIPVWGRISGGITGATILSLAYGPWFSAAIITIALLIKTVFINGTGFSSFPVICLILAYAGSFSGYCIYRRIYQLTNQNPIGLIISASLGGYFSSLTIAVITVLLVEFNWISNATSLHMIISFPRNTVNCLLTLLSAHIFHIAFIEALLTSLLIIIFNLKKVEEMLIQKNFLKSDIYI